MRDASTLNKIISFYFRFCITLPLGGTCFLYIDWLCIDGVHIRGCKTDIHDEMGKGGTKYVINAFQPRPGLAIWDVI